MGGCIAIHYEYSLASKLYLLFEFLLKFSIILLDVYFRNKKLTLILFRIL